MKKFLDIVIDDLVARCGVEGLGRLTIVLPMARAGMYIERGLRRHILEAGRAQMAAGESPRPVLMPRFTTINSLVDQLSGLNPDDEIRSVCTLYAIYVDKTKDIRKGEEPMKLELFYNWGRQLLTDFGNIDKSGVDAKKLLSNAADAKVLEENDLHHEALERLRELFPIHSRSLAQQESTRMQFEQLWQRMPDIYEALNTWQSADQVGYPGARLRKAVAESERWLPHVQDRQFVFVGFNYLQEEEKQLLRLLRDHNQALFYWDYRQDFRTNPMAYYFQSQNILEFPNACPETTTKTTTKTIVRAVATTTANVQAQYVRNWLLERKDQNGRFAIVIADETMLEPVLYAIPEQFASRVNITKGYPMRSTKVYADILHELEEKQLRAPKGSCIEVLDGLLNGLLRVEDEIQVESLFDEADETAEIDWQQQLVEESVAKARSVVSRMRQLLVDGVLIPENCDRHTLLCMVRRQLESETVSFAGEPITDIQVIGVLETRLLDFDHLLVLGVEEGVLPSTPADKSFIPYYLRKYYGLQTNDEGAWAYAYNFFRLIRRCEDVTMVFSDSTDEGHKGMSRFLMQMITSPEEFEVRKYRIAEDTTVLPMAQDTDTTLVPAEYTFHVTPSSLTAFLSCRRRWYYQDVLRLKVPTEADTTLQSSELGNLIHALIRAAYLDITAEKEKVTIRPEAIRTFLADDERRSKAMDRAYVLLNEHYRKHHPEETSDVYLRAEHPVENRVAELHMQKVLKNDAERGAFILWKMEHKHYGELCLNDGTKLNIGGDIDRLDVVRKNGVDRLRIVDYKTGKYDADRMVAAELGNLFEDGTKQYYMLQTLVYSWVCSEKKDEYKGFPIMPVLLYTGRDLQTFDPHLKIGGEDVLDFATLKTPFVEALKELIETMRQTLAAQEFDRCPEDRCHKFCSFHLICGREKSKY